MASADASPSFDVGWVLTPRTRIAYNVASLEEIGRVWHEGAQVADAIGLDAIGRGCRGHELSRYLSCQFGGMVSSRWPCCAFLCTIVAFRQEAAQTNSRAYWQFAKQHDNLVKACTIAQCFRRDDVVGSVGAMKGSEQALMSAVSQQLLLFAIETDQSTFLCCSLDVLAMSCGANSDHGVPAVRDDLAFFFGVSKLLEAGQTFLVSSVQLSISLVNIVAVPRSMLRVRRQHQRSPVTDCMQLAELPRSFAVKFGLWW